LLREELSAILEADTLGGTLLAKELARRIQEIKQEGSSFTRAAIRRYVQNTLLVQQSCHLSFEVEEVP
jgi:hypothetical protein